MTVETGFRGTYVISWSQTTVEGIPGPDPEMLSVGATWGWSGEILRLDGPRGLLRLEGAMGEGDLRHRAARRVAQLVGAAFASLPNLARSDDDSTETPDSCFVVTDGARSFTVTLIETGAGKAPLAMFHDSIPPAETDLWIVHEAIERRKVSHDRPEDAGMICFTPGTRIHTPDGPRLVEDLREGDLIQTKDNGPQEILWRGARRMSGARLFALPRLRPIRIHACAFGNDLPDTTFLVSPDHKMIVRGAVARDLFNTPEVLATARDLVNDDTIAVDFSVREVTYVHLLLPRHEIIWANGVETESFHPGDTSLTALSSDDRARLIEGLPGLSSNPGIYGASARRVLSQSDAALLRHVA